MIVKYVFFSTTSLIFCTSFVGKNKGGKAPAVAVVPDEPLEKFYPGSNAVSSVSASVCQAGALSSKKPLYRHIADLMHGKVFKCLLTSLNYLYDISHKS